MALPAMVKRPDICCHGDCQQGRLCPYRDPPPAVPQASHTILLLGLLAAIFLVLTTFFLD